MSEILVIDPNEDDQYAEEAALDGIEDAQEPESRNWLMGIAAGLIVSLVLIGETVGGLIGLNNYETFELGFGTSTIVNCDREITVKPISEFDTATTTEFRLSAVEISGIHDDCFNKTFTLSLYSSPFGDKANFVTRNSVSVNYLRFVLATLQPEGTFNDLNWRVYPREIGEAPTATIQTPLNSKTLPDPLSTSGLTACLGEGTYTLDIDFDSADLNWSAGTPYANVVCPRSGDYLMHMSGYIKFPGDDDGKLHSTTMGLSSTGNVQLSIGNKSVISDRTTHGIQSKSGSVLHRKGAVYPFELWYYKGSTNGALILTWNRGSDGELSAQTLVPNSAFTSSAPEIGIVIPSSEKPNNYTATGTLSSNNNFVRINLGLPRITTADVSRFTLETSD